MSKRQLYAGLMSGTSVDGIDAALVDFSGFQASLITSHSHSLPDIIKSRINELCNPASQMQSSNKYDQIDLLGELHIQLGQLFAEALLTLIEKARVNKKDVIAVGSHGQTIRHRPNPQHPFSLQIADPNTIAERSGITTVADFRLRDMAAGGQGAPLVPAFHKAFFRSKEINRIILNIGGIANITLLDKNDSKEVLGFDTGPGNTLMDQWIKKNKGLNYDDKGTWAANGTVNEELLQALLSHPYLSQPTPKSTGREEFNLSWLESKLANFHTSDAQDIQLTLLHFTAISISQAIKNSEIKSGEILICGGGAHNTLLMNCLSEQLPDFKISTTEAAGCPPDWVEAMAFAWLAKQSIHQLPGNLPDVTGAKNSAILGGIYFK